MKEPQKNYKKIRIISSKKEIIDTWKATDKKDKEGPDNNIKECQKEKA